MLVCSLWAPELPMHLARNSRFWFAVPLPSFLLWKEMDHFACLTGPPADIAGGRLLVWVDCTFYCNNLAWELSWIGLVCSQDDAASHWHSQGRVLNTFLNLAHEIPFFFFFKSEGLSWFCLGNKDLHKCILEGCRRFKQCYMRTPCFSQCTARHSPSSVIIFRTTKHTGWGKNDIAQFCERQMQINVCGPFTDESLKSSHFLFS